ncbi:MAG TPA: M1 family metallopeptidase [Acidimicrobiales bacterium]|nr:M1 family metallopeptidase [Acidimicrobiales bacterium]
MSDDARYRLPTGVVPVAHRLRFEPDLDAATFTGTAEVDVVVVTATEKILLNAVELELDRASAVLADGTSAVATVSVDAEFERVTLAFDAAIPTGPAVLQMGFSGTLNDRLLGFYRSTFRDEAGTEHTIATTQLCATDARRMFPCFDEPALKATFELTVVIPSDLSAYANSPVASASALPDGRREVRFLPTMKMSTYLVALVVGRFEQSEVIDVDGVPLSVVCTPGKSHLAAHALEVGAFALRYFTSYFGIPYPGDKVDLVGIPDFAAGAMENLGCITFRETLLLVDPATASTRELQDVAMVVAHELAHMWFGDLVTMQWWEGIWLNEAFATFMQYLCTDAFRPEWSQWVLFNVQREPGFAIDALHSTRAIEFPVHSSADAWAMFDAITYRKGGAVLRMLEQYQGADVFREGIRRYVADHAYANTVTADLWAALEAASGEPVGEIMTTWILQGGHPLVEVSGGTLSQSPFQFRSPEGASSIGSSWRVPVRSRPLAGGPSVAQLLGDVPAPLATPWPAVVNAGGSGVYRTSYGTEELAEISASLNRLTELERAVLLSDTWALARAGLRTVGDVLTVAGGLGTLVEPSAWAVVDDVLDTLSRIVDDADRPALEACASRLFAPVLEALGWSPGADEDELAPVVRASAVRVLGTVARDAEVRAEAASRFDSGVLDGDLAAPIVDVVASMDRPGDLDEMLRRCREAKDPQSEERYRDGATAISNQSLAVSVFERCFELFRSQDVPLVIFKLVSNPVGGPAVWEALTSTWDATLAEIPESMQFFVGLGTSTLISDRTFAARVAAFHRAHPIATSQSRVEQAIEQMIDGVTFAERARPGLAVALR